MCEVCHLEHEPEYPCEAALASERSALWQERAVKAERLLLELRQEDNDCDEKLEKAERERDEAESLQEGVEYAYEVMEQRALRAEAKLARIKALVKEWQPFTGKRACADDLEAALTVEEEA